MRNLIAKAAVPVFLALIALFIAGAAPAQDTGMRMDIPVPFIAGNVVLPAGSYVVRVDDRFRVLRLQGTEMSASLLLTSKSTRRSTGKLEKGSLCLHQYGNAYVLKNVWQRNNTEGWNVVRSSKEVELVRANPVPRLTTIAAN